MPVKEPLTPESLERAYRHLRKSEWVGGLEDALNDPIRGRIIRGVARLMQTGLWGSQQEKQGISRPSRGSLSTLKVPRTYQGIDLKSRAAGERNDD